MNKNKTCNRPPHSFFNNKNISQRIQNNINLEQDLQQLNGTGYSKGAEQRMQPGYSNGNGYSKGAEQRMQPGYSNGNGAEQRMQPGYSNGNGYSKGAEQRMQPGYSKGAEQRMQPGYSNGNGYGNGNGAEQRMQPGYSNGNGAEQRMQPSYSNGNGNGAEQRMQPGYSNGNGAEQRMQPSYSNGSLEQLMEQQSLMQDVEQRMQPGYSNGNGAEQRMQPGYSNGNGAEQRMQPGYSNGSLEQLMEQQSLMQDVEQRMQPGYSNGNGAEQRMQPGYSNGNGAEQRMQPGYSNGNGAEQRMQPSYGNGNVSLEQLMEQQSLMQDMNPRLEQRMQMPLPVQGVEDNADMAGLFGNGPRLEQRMQMPSLVQDMASKQVSNYEQPSYARNNNEDSLCMNNVCYNKYNGGSLNPNDRDFSYSEFNFGLSTKLQYDPCYINDDIEQSTQPLLSILDPNRVKNNEQCLSTLGPRSGKNGYGDNIPIQNPGLTPAQELVDIDSIMSNRNVKQSRCKSGNVNPIDVFKFKTFNSKECNSFLNPLETINSVPKQNYREISINRFYDLNINPQVNIYYDGAVNTQLEAKDNFSNPYPYFLTGNSSNEVKGKPVSQYVNVYDNKTNSLLTGTNGQKYKL
jgi:hypothetical protein